MLGFADIPEDQKTETNKVDLLVPKRFTGLDGNELSEMMQLSHSSILNSIIQNRKTDETLIPTTIATIPQIRMTRKILGEYTLHYTEKHKFFSDSIGMVSDWRKRGTVYEIPFSTLFPKKVKNLITAGRCTSVTDSMWNIMRVIPCCAVTRQTAGTAATISNDFSNLDIHELQTLLKDSGVILDEKDLM